MKNIAPFGTVNVVPPSEISSNFVDIHSGGEMSKPMYSADGRLVEGEDAVSGVMYNAAGIVSPRRGKFSPRFDGETEIELSNFDKMDIGVPNIISDFVGSKRNDFATPNFASSFKGQQDFISHSADGDEKNEEKEEVKTTTTTTSQPKPSASKTETGRILGMQKKTAMFVGGALLVGLGILGYYKFVKK